MPKQSKSAFKLDILFKEVNHFEKNLVSRKCIKNKNRIICLKNEISEYKKSLNHYFGELAQTESDDYFEQYVNCKDKLLEWTLMFEEQLSESSEIESSISHSNKNIAVQLPKLEIPIFYGNNETWLSFKEIFKNSIIDNNELNDIQRLQFLQNYVRGDAFKLIRGFPIIPENFQNCWDILCERFDNKRQLALAQINKIFNVKITKANSAKSLLDLIDISNEVIRNLKTLTLPGNELSDLIIINFLISKIDDEICHRWELTLKNNSIPTFIEFKTFIEREARSLEGKNLKSDNLKKSQVKPFNSVKKVSVNSNICKSNDIKKVESKFKGCCICPEFHALFKCPIFNAMTVHERLKTVKDKQLCENCLRDNHRKESCRINISCKNCQARHHTLLHVYTISSPESTPHSIISVAKSNTGNLDSHVLLSTATLNVKSSNGNIVTIRALVDSASQNSLITRKCAEKLNLHLIPTNHRLIGINNTYAETSLLRTSLSFSAHFSNELFSIEALVVSKVTTNLPTVKFKPDNWVHLNHLELADPLYYLESEVDVLIGADIFASLIIGPPIMGPKGTPVALPTKLGHLLSGSINIKPSKNVSITCHAVVEDQLQKFWELEAIPEPTKLEDEDEVCENIFANSHKRNKDGRFIVKLPFVEDNTLGDSQSGALKRFYSLEKKLQSDDKLRQKYTEFMTEYEELGHMTPVNINSNSPHYFLPHHGVINENSTTTKLRVVFDGSFKTSNGKSLNNVLLKGKKLQTDIFTILLQFRTFKIAFSSDITKMYRQILVADEDTAFQQILWRKSPTEPIEAYKLRTVTYGLSSSPYLAIRSLKQLCQDEKSRFPKAAEFALDHFYVDDMLGGADSVDEAKLLIQELLSLMSSGGFELRKWTSNHPGVLATMPDELTTSVLSHSFDNDETQKILGLVWDLREDAFQIKAVSEPDVLTKRQLLSVIARTFDPIGFISPSTIILKMLLQEIWKENLVWDDKLPSKILDKWNKFQSEMHYFAKIKIPRYLQTYNIPNYELHGFCDSSTKAYAAVIYLRIVSSPNHVFLLASKTRVAPVKTVTLPRLELCGALLLAELLQSVKLAINLPISKTFMWCDSTITLAWISNPPMKGNQFVQHRVDKIRNLTKDASWNHLPGKSNPADCATRGLYPKQLYHNSEWLTGPNWLINFHSDSVNKLSPTETQSANILAAETSISMVTHSNDISDLLEKFSSSNKLIRVMAWILRFVNNLKSESKAKGPLQSTELDKSEKIIIALLQSLEYVDEIRLIKAGKPLPRNSKLLSLNPFLDSDSILRVGGRLRHQPDLSENQKHPSIIPKNHSFTKGLIRQIHKSNFHAGQNLVLSLIRNKYWIPDGKSTVRQELRKCISCVKFHARPSQEMMGDLPAARITPCKVFQRVGIDFAGPISTKCQHSRKSNHFKSYICVYICMCTKAVHLELVSSLTTSAFLASFRRFIARRGYPSDVFSDNGKNFVGAASYLKQLFSLTQTSEIQDFSSEKRIQWHFTPPYAPNFGGIWEAAVKLTKMHLTKTLSSTLLNFEELSTLLSQIEACINSRPLLPLSPDPHDLQALTPGHFLIGRPLLEIPEKPINQSTLSYHSRWSLLLQLKARFWEIWKRSYLHHLQERAKWKQGCHAIQVGDLVILKDFSLSSPSFILGRIIATHPGHDQRVRVVTVRCSKGDIRRTTSKMIRLPIVDADLASPPAGSMSTTDIGVNNSQ